MEVKPRFRDPEIVSQRSGSTVLLLCFFFFFSFRLAVGQFGGHVLHFQAVAAQTVVQGIEEG